MRWLGPAAAFFFAACVPQLTGAPCHQDNNCPVNQYCDGTNCQSGTPPPTRVLQLVVTTPAGILPLGATVQATATAVLQSGAQQDVTASATWSTSNARVAQVSNDAGVQGQVLALATGEVDVDAILDATSGSAHLVVTDAQLISLVVTVDRPVVAARTDVVCTAMGFFTDGTHADLTSLATWTSSQPAVVSVSNTPGNVGALVAVAPGTSQLSASYQQLTGSADVSVTDATLSALFISPLVPWVSTNTSAALVATGLFSDGTAQPMTGSVQWTVDDPSLAFFLPSVAGVVQGFAAGTTVAEAQTSAFDAQVPLLVSGASLAVLEVSPALPDSIGIGGATAFTAWGTFSDQGVLELTGQASWSATNPEVLAVPPNSGVALALDAGTADVDVAFNSLVASATQSVDPAAPVALLVWPPTSSLTVGLPYTLAAERVLADGSVDDVTQLAGWNSTCPAQVQVATGVRGGAVFARSAKACTTGAKLNGLYGSASLVAVSRAVQRLEVSPSQLAIGPGGWGALTATAIFFDGSELDVTALSGWTSDTGFAVVGNGPEAGQALGADAGVSQLTATFGGAVGSAAVSVQPQLVGLELWPPLLQLHAGTERSLRATAVWPAGDAVDVTPWTVFTSNNPAVIRVANAAGTRGTLGGAGLGTATVTAVFGPALAHASLTVDAATPQGVTISGPVAIPSGEPAGFQATAQFSDGSSQDVSSLAAWTSSTPSVLRLRGTGPARGSASALDTGNAQANAHYGGIAGNALVTTTPAGVQTLSVGALASAIPAGVQLQLVATASFTDGVQLDVTSRAVWTSLSPNVASIANGPSAGLLTAHNPGSAQLTCSFEGSTVGASVVVSSATLTSVTILPSLPGGAVGSEVPLMAQGSFSDGSQFDLTQQARWSSANVAVVAVSNGAQTRGTAMALVAESSSVAASVIRPDLTVVTGSAPFVGGAAVVTGVEILPANILFSLSAGGTVKLRANAHLSDGTVEDVSTQVGWSMQSSGIAEVTASGELTALKTGATAVQAKFVGVVGLAAVVVNP
jgi:trimeric autotransporter adhesin